VPDGGVDRELEVIAVHEGVEVGGREVDAAGLEPALVVDVVDGQRRDGADEVAQCVRMRFGRPVLDDDDCGAEVGGQPAEDDAECLQAAPRGAHRNEVAGSCLCRIHVTLRNIFASASTTS
jgi:hypothetical protein